jgi:protein CpxP
MKSTQKILIAALILMVLLNIGTLGFVFLRHQHGPYFMREGFRQGRFMDKLKMTEEQKKSIEKLRNTHEEKMSSLRAMTDSLRKQRFELMKITPYDSSQGNILAARLGDIQEEMEKQITSHFLSIRALCTQEQLPEYNKFIDRLSSRMSNGSRYGGGRQGCRNRNEEKDCKKD